MYLSSVFFGWLRVYALLACLICGSLSQPRPLQRVPSRAQVSCTQRSTRANVQFKCTTRRGALWTFQYLRGAYAKTVEQTEGRQKKQLLYTWRAAFSHDSFNKRLREKPTRGVTRQPMRRSLREPTPPTRIASTKYMQFSGCTSINPFI